jgi:Protein of unknown function (DUF3300)
MMLHRAMRIASLSFCFLVLTPLPGMAQNQPPPAAASPNQPPPSAASPAQQPPTAAPAQPAPTTAPHAQPATAEKLLKPEELAALVAPIALYPDNLLSLVLMASTYPVEVVQADRWTKDNKKLKGDQLKAAVDKQS